MDRSTKWLLLAAGAAIMLLPANTLPDPARSIRLATAEPGIPAAAAHATDLAPVKRRVPRFQRGRASAYGPGLYGNTMACGGTLRPSTVAVAHRSMRCGAVLVICRTDRRRCTRATVRDRGPYVRGRTHDLTVGAVRRLGVSDARSWGVRDIRWRCIRKCR